MDADIPCSQGCVQALRRRYSCTGCRNKSHRQAWRHLFPIRVSNLASDTTTTVAGESDESHAKRKALTSQLNLLMQGLETCKRFVVGTSHGMSLTPSLESTGQLQRLMHSCRQGRGIC